MTKRTMSEIVLIVLVLCVSTLALNIQRARADGLVGDFNGDGTVDIKDVAGASLAFGSYLGDPRWNPKVDLNGDNVIDMVDLVIIAKNFGANS
ncbi:MAG: hypothetical protein WBV70_03685 [Candidatus Bathyarchaeia archaeon]